MTTQIHVAAESPVSGTAQSIRSELDKSGTVEICAIGKDANYVTIKAIASASAMFGYGLPLSVEWQSGAGSDGRKSALSYKVFK